MKILIVSLLWLSGHGLKVAEQADQLPPYSVPDGTEVSPLMSETTGIAELDGMTKYMNDNFLNNTFCSSDAPGWFLQASQLWLVMMRAHEFTAEEKQLALDVVAVPTMVAGYLADIKCKSLAYSAAAITWEGMAKKILTTDYYPVMAGKDKSLYVLSSEVLKYNEAVADFQAKQKAIYGINDKQGRRRRVVRKKPKIGPDATSRIADMRAAPGSLEYLKQILKGETKSTGLATKAYNLMGTRAENLDATMGDLAYAAKWADSTSAHFKKWFQGFKDYYCAYITPKLNGIPNELTSVWKAEIKC